MIFSWHHEDTMLGTFDKSAEAVERARALQARPPAPDGVEMVPVLGFQYLGWRLAGDWMDWGMARPPRFQYSGAVYHVMGRGNGRGQIFITKEDHESFLQGKSKPRRTSSAMIFNPSRTIFPSMA
jgi:hypothetical protein